MSVRHGKGNGGLFTIGFSNGPLAQGATKAYKRMRRLSSLRTRSMSDPSS